MKSLLRTVLALMALATISVSATRAEPVDLLLVLAADVSRSVDHQKFLLQREGYAAAIANGQVMEAVRSGMHGKIGLLFLEWSGVSAQKVVIDWTAIDGPESARRFGDQLVEVPRSFSDRTSVSGGIDFAVMQFKHAPFELARRTIDVSGDGTNNAGRDVGLARRSAETGHHNQWTGDLERAAGAVESGTHQSAGRAAELLPRSRHWRPRIVRAGGGRI